MKMDTHIYINSLNSVKMFQLDFIAGYVANFHKPANKVVLLHVIENLGIQDMSKSSHCAHSVIRT